MREQFAGAAPRGALVDALAVVACAVALLGARPAAAEDETSRTSLLISVPDRRASQLVHRSVRGAASRLRRSEECRALLGDFTTAAGESLASVLGERGQSPDAYLASLVYLDGTLQQRCRSGMVLAFTAPGWRVVYVCSSAFLRLERRPAVAEAVLIHEALHTLGLGENPPTPRAIQDQVEARCLAPR